ncbi:MAG: MBL fold metallo-hydrolase [Oscillospiraceae bacterium]|nr:MBL fold metallo-hydrolase [Oscillospiraceae bacterium]
MKKVLLWILVGILILGVWGNSPDHEAAPSDKTAIEIPQTDISEAVDSPSAEERSELPRETETPKLSVEASEKMPEAPAPKTEEGPGAETAAPGQAELADESEQPEEKPEQPAEEAPAPSSFAIHFLDVGQADAALVLCDGSAMLIDGGNSKDSSLIYAYLKSHDVSHLDYIVATHAHEDHVGGLAGALNYAAVGTAYCSVSDFDSEAFRDFVKYLGKQGKSITVPQVGETFSLGSASVQIVGVNGSAEDHNNSSIILRIVYGETSFLFTGDAEREAEQAVLNAGYPLDSTVLKVGHHGSKSSAEYLFLRTVAPKYAVISVGAGNSYGHPTEDTLSRLRDADVKVYRTDLQGTIVCTSDGSTVSFSVSKNPDADTLKPQSKPQVKPTAPAPPAEVPSGATDYVGNRNTKKFHYASCGSVGKMKEKNKHYYTGTRDGMIAQGYEPCGNCKP